MRKVLVTEEHVLLAQRDDKAGLYVSQNCAVHHALRPFIKSKFCVGAALAFSDDGQHTRYLFRDNLPNLLYTGKWDKALADIEEFGAYEIYVEGI